MKLFGKQEPVPPFVTAIIAAAGSSRRMGGEDKQKMDLCGIPVLGRTLLAFEQCALVREIIVAAGEDRVVDYADLGSALGISKLTRVIRGGVTRMESVWLAAQEIDPGCEYLAVHDGARPLVTPALIEQVCRDAFAHSAAVAAVPVYDTIKQAGADGRIDKTVDRALLRAAQTPQAADRALLLAAIQSAREAGFAATDECAALERMGVRPWLTPGEESNRKITTPIDLVFARAVLEERGTV